MSGRRSNTIIATCRIWSLPSRTASCTCCKRETGSGLLGRHSAWRRTWDGASARACARIVSTITTQIDELAQELSDRFEQHPDAKIIRSLPGLGPVLGARALGEFGDEPTRYADARARKNYATTSPVTRASGKQLVVDARRGGNRRLGDVCLRWALCAIQSSPGARRYYDALRVRQKTNTQALRAVANRLVGILHSCLAKRAYYDEDIAWPVPLEVAA